MLLLPCHHGLQGPGETCTLVKGGACPCCQGLTCWAGPVVPVGEKFGKCLDEAGPKPIGR
jgi:hypothetical protein